MALTDNLIAYYDGDEASGNLIDAHGANDLTDTNTVGTDGAGARLFTQASSEYFTRADNSDFSVAGHVDCTFTAVVEVGTGVTLWPIIGKDDGSGNREYLIYWQGDKFLHRVNGSVEAQSNASFASGTKYFVQAQHNAATDKVRIRVNSGSWVETNHSAGITDAAAPFRIGQFATFYFGGTIQKIGFWKRCLSDVELDTVYNGAAADVLDYAGLLGTVRTQIAVDDADLVYSPYNWVLSGSTYAQTNNPGAYLKARFTGTSVRLNVDTSPHDAFDAEDWPVIAHRVVGQTAWTRYQIVDGDVNIVLAAGLADSTYDVEVRFAAAVFGGDRWTTPTNVLRITGIDLDDGEDVTTVTTRPNKILCYGDSHTEGHEAIGVGVSVANQDASQAWPFAFAEAFNAETGIVAFAGTGWTDDESGQNLPDFEDNWDFYYNGVSRLSAGAFIGGEPDYIFICHGDSEPGDVATAVENTLTAIRTAAPNAPILVMLPANLDNEAAIRSGVTAAGDANVYVLDPGRNLLTYNANGSHLHARGHAAFAAVHAMLAQEALNPGGDVAVAVGSLGGGIHQ